MDEFLREFVNVLTGEADGHGNPRPILGKFRYSDGNIEEVREQGRYNLLMKVPDVHLAKEKEDD